MKIQAINSNNQISHKAVNQKFLKRAQEEFKKYAPYHNQGHLISMIGIHVSYGLISYRDAIDTLEAIKPYAQDALEVIDEMIVRLRRSIK